MINKSITLIALMWLLFSNCVGIPTMWVAGNSLHQIGLTCLLILNVTLTLGINHLLTGLFNHS